jgi:phage tail sheath protein FI
MEKTPGVYIQEIGLLSSSVAPISTAIPAFIGYTEKGGGDERPLDRQAVRINSLLEYEQLYGKAENQRLTITVDTATDSPIKVAIAATNPSPYLMYYQVLMYFLNGGGPCYIISVNGYQSSGVRVQLNDLNEEGNTTAGRLGGLAVARKVDEITLLVFPDAPALSDTDYYGLYEAGLKQCSELQDRFTLIDVKDPVSINEGGTPVSPIAAFRGVSIGESSFAGIGNNYLNYGAAYYPYLNTTLSYQYDLRSTLNFVNREETAIAEALLTNLLTNTQFVASLERLIAGFPVTLPPSGAIAGIYAQTDRTRGVFKAPANVSLNSVISPARKITDEEQQELNVHPSGKSVNAIRAFAGKGVLVWGARTLEGNSNEWRYISVRRFFLFVEESLRKAIEPFIFEGNNENTWIRIRGLTENFLTGQWRAGALFGGTPKQAFFVNIGLGATMSAQDILEGRLIVEIGMAAVRPAEFIILRFTHKVQNA